MLALALVAGFFAASPTSAWAGTMLYVNATRGADMGQCQMSPCRTLMYAVTQGRTLTPPITIRAAPGTYNEDIALGAMDSGLTITGAGDGTSAATSTVVKGVSGQATFTTNAGVAGLSLNDLRIVNPPTDSADAIDAFDTNLVLDDVAIDIQGTGGGVVAAGDVQISGGSITLEDMHNGADALVNIDGPATIASSPIDVKGSGRAIVNTAGPVTLSDESVTMDDTASTSTALVLKGNGSSLSHVSVGGAWQGPVVIDTGSLSIADSSLSGSGANQPVALLSGDTTGDGYTVSIQRSTLRAPPAASEITMNNVDAAVDSSLLLGGTGLQFNVSGGVARTLTVASSTVDAGVLGMRDPAVQSLVASADDAAGSEAMVNVQGSILVEPPGATVAGTNGHSSVSCDYTEVPDTVQGATSSVGTIECASGANGNTSTASLSSIFADPGSSYAPNSTWGGVDSVPASAISLPAPFSDSATDLFGNPRVNGAGSCLPGERDKGAIELPGRAGVVPVPVISGSSGVPARVTATFSGKAPNVPKGVGLSFAWHSSDGSGGSGARFSHTFSRAGRYAVSLTVDGAEGCTGHASKSVTVNAIDVIGHLALSPSSFAAASSGATVLAGKRRHAWGAVISYRGTQSATTTFAVQRPAGGHRQGGRCRAPSRQNHNGERCIRRVNIGSFTNADRAGSIRFVFSGRLGGKKLSPGSYQLQAESANHAGTGPAVYAGFKIKAPRP